MHLRPQFPRINRNARLAKGLVFAGLGGGAGTLFYGDASVYGNNGTLTNFTSAGDYPDNRWAFVPAIGRKALTFDGSNDSVLCGAIPSMDAFTVSFWGKLAGAALFRTFLGFHALYANCVRVWTTGGVNVLSAGDANIATSNWTGVWADESLWRHVAWVVPATSDTANVTSRMYLDGVDLGAPDAPRMIYKTNNALRIGGHSTMLHPLNGSMADLLIHNYPLPQSLIQQEADPSNYLLSGLIDDGLGDSFAGDTNTAALMQMMEQT
jgi:hypothetical protein